MELMSEKKGLSAPKHNAGCFVLKFWIFSMLILFCIALYCEKDTDEADTLKSAEMRRRSIETFFG